MHPSATSAGYKDLVLFLATAGIVAPLFKRLKISPVLLGEVRRTDALTLVARRAREVAEAELALVLLYDEDERQFTVEVVDGADGSARKLVGEVLPADETTFVGSVTERRHELLENLAEAAPWSHPVVAGPAVVCRDPARARTPFRQAQRPTMVAPVETRRTQRPTMVEPVETSRVSATRRAEPPGAR